MYKINIYSYCYQQVKLPALKNIHLQIEQGDFIGITGPTGAGKSTLIKCLNGIIPHFQGGQLDGEIIIKGNSTKNSTVAEIARTVGSVFDDPEAQVVAPEVEQEVAFGLENMAVPPDKMNQRIEYSLHATGIAHLRHNSTADLSGGQKQRLAIASVLALMPEVLLLDEPTSELDPLGSKEIFQLLNHLNKKHGLTIIITEQKTELLARHVHKLLVMNESRIVFSGSPRNIFTHWQQVQALGIKVPQIAVLTSRLGADSTELPLTVNEGAAFINKLYGG